MSTAAVPKRRNKLNRRARREARKQAKAAVVATAAAPPPEENPEPSYVVVSKPAPSDPIDLEELAGRRDRSGLLLIHHRERAYAFAHAAKFERWLLLHVAALRIPLDNVTKPVELLIIFVEAALVAAATFPELYPPAVELEQDDEGETYLAPRTLAEARDYGMSPERKRPGLPRPTLPGCQGRDEIGAECLKLRRYGQRFCPCCAKKERARIREM